MRTLPYEEAKAGVSRVIERPLEEIGALSDWDLSFSEYIEEHKNSTLLFCWYAKYVAVVFSPADRHGIWVLRRENVSGKGKLPEYTVDALDTDSERERLIQYRIEAITPPIQRICVRAGSGWAFCKSQNRGSRFPGTFWRNGGTRRWSPLRHPQISSGCLPLRGFPRYH